MEQLTEAQLDHVVGRLLQLDLTMQDRYKYMEWVRGYLKYDEGVALEECEWYPNHPKTVDFRLSLLVYYSEHRGTHAQICGLLEAY